jgi:outer membrane protein assembly factor BamB
LANGVVYFGAIDNKVYALNASTGALLWSEQHQQPGGIRTFVPECF